MRTLAPLTMLLLSAPAATPGRPEPSSSSGPTPATARQVSVDIVQLFWNYGSSQHGGSPGTPAEGRKAMSDAAAVGMTYYRFVRPLRQALPPPHPTSNPTQWHSPLRCQAATHFWPVDQNATYLADEAEYWRKMDALFADAESLQVQLIPSLNWCLFLWPDLAGEPLHEMVANPHSASSAMLQKYVTTFVTRYANSPAVFAWELGNEYNLQVDLDFSDGCCNASGVAPPLGTPTHRSRADNFSTAELSAFQARYAGWIRAADSKRRPISTGHAVPRPGAWHLAQSYHAAQRDWGPDTEAQFRQSVATQSSGCELISYHYYPGPDNTRFGRTLGPANSAALFPHLVSAAKAAGKQWYIGEFGTTSSTDRQFTLNLLDQLGGVKDGPVMATMWVWEFTSSQPNISVVPGRQGDVAVIDKIKAVNAALKKTPTAKTDDGHFAKASKLHTVGGASPLPETDWISAAGHG